MGRTVSQKINRLPAGRRHQVKERATKLICVEMSLAELRKARSEVKRLPR